MTVTATADDQGNDGPDHRPEADHRGYEVIGGFRVHPVASMFPLIEGEEFEALVESILQTGGASPIEFHEGLLIDGRNRVRAIEVLQERGYEIEFQTVKWTPNGDETVEEYIFAKNVCRRHLSDDQRAMLAQKMEPVLREAAAARQAATRFGARQVPADTVSCPPADPPPRPRTRKEKTAATTNGQMAALANVSHHKVSQAKKVMDAAARGEVSQEDVDAVIAGNKKLRQVVPGTSKRVRCSTAPVSSPPAERISADDNAPVGSAPEGDEPAGFDELAPTEEEIRRRWEEFKAPFAVADYPKVRRLLSRIIAEEECR